MPRLHYVWPHHSQNATASPNSQCHLHFGTIKQTWIDQEIEITKNKFWKFLYCMASICTCDGYKKAYLWSRICITNKSSNCQGWLGLYSCISNGLKFKNQTVIKNENKIHVQLNYTGYFILFTWTKNIKLLNTNRILFCPQNVPHFKILLTNLCLKRYNLCF